MEDFRDKNMFRHASPSGGLGSTSPSAGWCAASAPRPHTNMRHENPAPRSLFFFLPVPDVYDVHSQGLKKMEGLCLPGLRELYLHQNKIAKIEGLEG